MKLTLNSVKVAKSGSLHLKLQAPSSETFVCPITGEEQSKPGKLYNYYSKNSPAAQMAVQTKIGQTIEFPEAIFTVEEEDVLLDNNKQVTVRTIRAK